MKIIKAIKQFYLTNKGISIIGIISVMISMSYVLTYKMPDYFGIEPLYAWLNSIAISYIAAMIFLWCKCIFQSKRTRNNVWKY